MKQLHYEDMIYAEKYSEVEMELRKIVDEMMRHELDLLQVFIAQFSIHGKFPKEGRPILHFKCFAFLR